MEYAIRDKIVFLTGGAGFIGSTLIEKLIDRNQIRVYDNFNRDAISHKSFITHPNLTIIRGDVLDYPTLASALRDSQYVVHCAAIAGIDTVIKIPTNTMRVNMIGTANVLEAARSLPNLNRLITFSTSEVFGSNAFRADENQDTVTGAVGEARWTYAVSKLSGEHLAHAYYKEFLMPTVTVRPFNIYGPGQIGEGAMRTFIQRALKNQEIQIHGEGNQIRAWCYVNDFIEGLLLAMVHPKAIGESFNIGNSRAVITIFGLAQTVIRVLNSSSTIRFVPQSSADIELRVPKVHKARELLGFEAKVDLEEGIKRTAEWYNQHREFWDK